MTFHGRSASIAAAAVVSIFGSRPNLFLEETLIITGKQAKSFDVYERQPIEIATGDKLLLAANRKTAGFRATNGKIVESINESSGDTGNSAGKPLPR